MGRIRIAILGVGNCASSLVQGFAWYRRKGARGQSPKTARSVCGARGQSPTAGQSPCAVGLMHWDVGGYAPGDVEVVCAFDVDKRKVGRDVADAIFAPPNCTKVFCAKVPKTGAKVLMGRVLDGVAEHMREYPESRRFVVAKAREAAQADIVRALKKSRAEIVVNYLPVGSERAVRFYADCAIRAGCAFVNNMPVFIASDPKWAAKFRHAGLPVIGDDIKAQMGATIVHRALVDLFRKRGVRLERTYQLNTGGNTDFLNMLDRARLASKKTSKTEAVQSAAAERLDDENIHIGPSDYVAWQKDNKVCFLRMEGKLFGGVPMDIELRLSVEDSPNSAGIGIDAIRCAKLALDRKLSGPVLAPSAYFMKHPPQQHPDDEAWQMVEDFISGKSPP